MRATKFEFEQRFWFIGLIFWVGFSLYALDRTNAALWVLHLVAPSVDPNSDHGNNLARLIFGGALLVFLAAAFRTWATAYLKTEIVHDLLASRAGWIFMVAVIWLFMYRLIFREEDGLLQTQGDSYRAYLEAVPRFWVANTARSIRWRRGALGISVCRGEFDLAIRRCRVGLRHHA